MSPLRIQYETAGFPQGTLTNGTAELRVTWDDLLWSAMTVGRPNRQYVFRHGEASLYEALFRISLVRMALEQRGPVASRLRRTEAAKTLDPSEKGAVNYFLGLGVCKLFATKLLRTPRLLHLDVFRPQLDLVLKGRSRPDLVGQQRGSGEWHAFECKGRISPPDAAVIGKAKYQASPVASVAGSSCVLHVGAVTHFRAEVLQFYWFDPPAAGPPIKVEVGPGAWAHYYGPFVHAFLGPGGRVEERRPGAFYAIEGTDVAVSLHPLVFRLLVEGGWDAARAVAEEGAGILDRDGYQPDGLAVKAGESWHERFKDPGADDER